jgi:hypothetical protein
MSAPGSDKEKPDRAKPTVPKKPKLQYRFGIGEWYGRPFVSLTAEERRSYASIQLEGEKPAQPCPFLSQPGKLVDCGKPGGICSLRLYERSQDTGLVSVSKDHGSYRTTCPNRFEQDRRVYRWIGETLLGDAKAIATGEIPFLKRVPRIGDETPQKAREVGRIDNVLVVPGSNPLTWCPVEKQAVYFSGKKMAHEFKYIASFEETGLPFPQFNRRPDYRSSGPKRLLPQLQVKVPTLRTWGKKMAVVVDEDFFNELGNINPANDLSNAEVVWFVVRYVDLPSGKAQLEPSHAFMTTLDESIKGLVAATPLPLPEFEAMLQSKLIKG